LTDLCERFRVIRRGRHLAQVDYEMAE
jgi:hypothetical protein